MGALDYYCSCCSWHASIIGIPIPYNNPKSIKNKKKFTFFKKCEITFLNTFSNLLFKLRFWADQIVVLRRIGFLPGSATIHKTRSIAQNNIYLTLFLTGGYVVFCPDFKPMVRPGKKDFKNWDYSLALHLINAYNTV